MSRREQDARDDATFRRFLATLNRDDLLATRAAYDEALARATDGYLIWSLKRRRAQLDAWIAGKRIK